VKIRVIAVVAFTVAIASVVAALSVGSDPAGADSTQRVRKSVSFSYDWDSSNATSTIYIVPQGYELLVTDVCAYWWGSGPAQRVFLYQDSELKGSFLATGRGSDTSTLLGTGANCFSSTQSGILFASGTSVRAVPSTTFLSITVAGVLKK
jgi:hypothetical protein